MKLERRMEIEKIIREALVDALLAGGFVLTLDNGGDEPEIGPTVDGREFKSAMGATDDEYIRTMSGSGKRSFVRLVYGNSGYDVIADYGTSLEIIVEQVRGLEDRFEAEAMS